MNSFVLAVVAAALGGALALAIAAIVRWSRDRARGGIARSKVRATGLADGRRSRLASVAELTRKQGFDRRVKQADANGELIVVAVSKGTPSIVTFSDGPNHAYFRGEFEAYKRAMSSGRYSPTRTHRGNPPAVGAVFKKSA